MYKVLPLHVAIFRKFCSVHLHAPGGRSSTRLLGARWLEWGICICESFTVNVVNVESADYAQQLPPQIYSQPQPALLELPSCGVGTLSGTVHSRAGCQISWATKSCSFRNEFVTVHNRVSSEASRSPNSWGVLGGDVVRVCDFFHSLTSNLKVSGSILHAITSANLDFHRCV